MIITFEAFNNTVNRLLGGTSKRCVIGLSGGADSLCLTLLMDEWARRNDGEISACIVDHKLRPESSSEILPIIQILKDRNIAHEVLVWQHEQIIGSIENKARIARYDLLYRHCKATNSAVLMTAHHALDQWETFFMRLSKGSSLKGLASINPVSDFKDIKLVRPMLKFSPADIKETLKTRFGIGSYVQDPSNESLEFERVRWRKSYSQLSQTYNLNVENIGQTIERLQSANDCLARLARDYFNQIFDGLYINIAKFGNLHLELKIRIITLIINRLSKKDRIISYSLLCRVATQISQKAFSAINIAGFIFRRDKTKNVKVYEEHRG